MSGRHSSRLSDKFKGGRHRSLRLFSPEDVARGIARLGDRLRESEARLSLATESTGLGTWDYDVATKSLKLSKRAVELFDLGDDPKSSFSYDHFFKKMHRQDRPRIKRQFNQCLSRGGKCAEEMEFRIHVREGGIRRFLTRAQAFVDGAGPKPNRLIGTVVDITDRRNRELDAQELKLAADRTQGELVAAEMRARSNSIELEARVWERSGQLTVANKELADFNYSVSHDLRAPLRSIVGFSEILRTSYHEKLDERGKNYLRRIESATQQMSVLIDAMMSLSRATLVDLVHEELDLSELAGSIGSELQEAQPGRQVRLSIEPGLKVSGDKALLEMALRCLLDNAWKFTARNPAAAIEVGSVRERAGPIYFVRDNGVGFEQTYAKKMFQPFQRLHAKEGFAGTGIGLALVSRVIERHGGQVWAESTSGEGSTFYFTLRGSHD
jgi:signal transduction histidine kinase